MDPGAEGHVERWVERERLVDAEVGGQGGEVDVKNIHGLAGHQPDDVVRVKDVKGYAEPARRAVGLVDNIFGRLGEVVLGPVGVFVEVIVHGIDAVLLAGQGGQLLRFAQAAGGVTEIIGKGADHTQGHPVAFAGVLLDVVHRAGDVVEHVGDAGKGCDEARVGQAEGGCQAQDGGVTPDDVAEDRRLGLQGVEDGLDAGGDGCQVGDNGPHVIGNERPEIDIEVVVAELRCPLAGCPGDAHGVADAWDGRGDAASGHLQFEVDIQANCRGVQSRLENGRGGHAVEFGQSELPVFVRVGQQG